MKKSNLRQVMLSGDWIPLNMSERIRSLFRGADVMSLGGATEASIWSIFHRIDGIDKNWKSIPYGTPLANQKIYILNTRGDLCPVGVQGDIYIGGEGLFMGYLNEPERNQEAFLNHEELGLLYRTGDMGIFHSSGYVEFLGRQDTQIKIRGYRVEAGEVESCLIQHPGISNVLVIDQKENARIFLCAYIIKEYEFETEELQEFLRQKLPDYMIPSFFVELDRFPLSANGKILRNELPMPKREPEKEDIGIMENPFELKLLELWESLLDAEIIKRNDNFFELGGDSLIAGQMIMGIQAEWGVDIPLDLLFEEPTIARIASYIRNNMET